METIQQEIKRFEPKQESALITKLNKIFSLGNCSEEQAVNYERVNVISASCVIMAIGKTEQAKRILSRFLDVSEDKSMQKEISLNYKVNVETIINSRFNITLLCLVMDVFKCFKDLSVNIQVNKDYPITIESEHFKFIIAPRVGDD